MERRCWCRIFDFKASDVETHSWHLGWFMSDVKPITYLMHVGVAKLTTKHLMIKCVFGHLGCRIFDISPMKYLTHSKGLTIQHNPTYENYDSNVLDRQ